MLACRRSLPAVHLDGPALSLALSPATFRISEKANVLRCLLEAGSATSVIYNLSAPLVADVPQHSKNDSTIRILIRRPTRISWADAEPLLAAPPARHLAALRLPGEGGQH